MDYLAGACELIGKILVGNKNRWGFVAQMVGSVFWIYAALHWRMYGLLIVAIPCFAVNMRNYLKWRREG